MKQGILILATLALLGACGGGDRSARLTGEQQVAADAGIAVEEYRALKASATERLAAADEATLRAIDAEPCDGFKGARRYAECIADDVAARETLTRRFEDRIAADPLAACVETRVRMGGSEKKARRLCAAVSADCQGRYAKRFLKNADKVTSGLLGAQGKGYYRCGATNEVIYAGQGFRDRSLREIVSDRTVLSADPCHGEQVEYLSADGRAFLWYGSNARVVTGEWDIVTEPNDPRISIRASNTDGRMEPQYCQRYQSNSFNPVTRKRGGGWECLPMVLIAQGKADSVAGDVFNLSRGGATPRSLRAGTPRPFLGYAPSYPNAACRGGRVVRAG